MIKEAIRRTEATFENSGYWIHDHPKRVILMMLLIVVFLASQLPSIQFDTSTESFFEKDDPTLLEYDAFREQFGRDEIVLALIHPKDVFEITFLEKLKAFHQELRVFQNARIFIEGKVSRDLLPDILDKGVYDALPRNNREAYDQYRQSLMENELREAYFQISPLSFMDLKLGRQIMIWGTADSLSVVDVLNPRDNRVPGLIDVEDARLPLNALKVDFYSGNWNLSAVAIPDIRFGKNPDYGSEYYFYSIPDNFSAENNILPKEEIPESGTENAEYGVSFQGNFSGWDWMLYHADFYNDQPRVVFAPGLETKSRVHDRLKLYGTGISLVSGSWLWKAEAAQVSGFRFYGTDQEYERQDLMFGIEYAGISDASLGFEISRRSYPDFDSILENHPNNADEHVVQSAFNYRQDFWNQTLHLNSFALILGESWNKGTTARISLDYDWFDAFSVGGGWLVYQKGSDSEYSSSTSLAFANQISRNDRIFLEIAYSF